MFRGFRVRRGRLIDAYIPAAAPCLHTTVCLSVTFDPAIMIKMGIAAPRDRETGGCGKNTGPGKWKKEVFNIRIRQDMTFLAALYVTLKQRGN